MEIRATGLRYRKGTTIQVTFLDGTTKSFDMATLFDQYPQFRALEDRKLFISGKLYTYLILWNDELDIGTDTIYELGTTVRKSQVPANVELANAVYSARVRAQMSKEALSEASGITLAYLSRIEAGTASPSLRTLHRIAEALGCELRIQNL